MNILYAWYLFGVAFVYPVREREAPDHQTVKQHARGPYVGQLAVIRYAVQQLGRHVRYAATHRPINGASRLLRVGTVGSPGTVARRHTKIGQTDAPPVVQQDIVHFDIAVRETVSVHVFDCCAQLRKPLVGLRLWCVRHLVVIVKQRAVFVVIHHEITPADTMKFYTNCHRTGSRYTYCSGAPGNGNSGEMWYIIPNIPTPRTSLPYIFIAWQKLNKSQGQIGFLLSGDRRTIHNTPDR